jgi:hypothetical protein
VDKGTADVRNSAEVDEDTLVAEVVVVDKKPIGRIEGTVLVDLEEPSVEVWVVDEGVDNSNRDYSRNRYSTPREAVVVADLVGSCCCSNEDYGTSNDHRLIL